MGRLTNAYAAVLRTVVDSKKLNAVCFAAEALYFRLLCVCDGAGRYHGDPFDVASKAMTGRMREGAADARECGVWLDELEREGLIERYEVDGEPILEICGHWRPASQKLSARFPARPGARRAPAGARRAPDGAPGAPAGSAPAPSGVGEREGEREREGQGQRDTRACARDSSEAIRARPGHIPEDLWGSWVTKVETVLFQLETFRDLPFKVRAEGVSRALAFHAPPPLAKDAGYIQQQTNDARLRGEPAAERVIQWLEERDAFARKEGRPKAWAKKVLAGGPGWDGEAA